MDRFWIGRAWFDVYWGAFATMLTVLALLLWRRGTETRLAPRLVLAWRCLRGAPAWLLGLAAAVWLGSGAFIYYNTCMLNRYVPSKTRFDRLADYEKKYRQYVGLAQPRITDVEADVDIFPERRAVHIRGHYALENKTAAAENAYRRSLAVLEKLAADGVAQPTDCDRLARTHYNLGGMQQRSGKTGEAEKNLRRAVQLNPNLVNGHFALAAILMQRQNYAAAQRSYFQAWWTAAFPALALMAFILLARLAAGLDEGERP